MLPTEGQNATMTLAHWQRQITSTTTLDNKGGISKYAINSSDGSTLLNSLATAPTLIITHVVEVSGGTK